MATTQPPNMHRLPNGHDEAAYKGYEEWSIHRWGWEFLSRNEEFIKACREPVRMPDQQLLVQTDIARQFHLRRFKHCDEPYDVGKKPSLNIATIFRCEEDQPRRGIQTSIRQAEILVRFDVDLTLKSSNALRVQLAMAETALTEHARMLARIRNTKLSKNNARVGTVADRIKWLRMLDAARHARDPETPSGDKKWSQPDIYRNLFPIEAMNMKRDELQEKFDNAVRTPERFTQHVYVEMMIKGQKSSKKTKPVDEVSE